MAKLVMTIDSDDEISKTVKKLTAPSEPKEDDQIFLNSDMVINTAATTGKQNQWSFKDAVVLGKHAQSLHQGLSDTAYTDDRAPF